MSYTKTIKNELAVVIPETRCCRISEIAGMINTAGSLTDDNILRLKTENWAVARKYFTLLQKTFNIDVKSNYVKKTKTSKNSMYDISIIESDEIEKALSATGTRQEGQFTRHISGMVLKNICCKRAYIRGAFLTGGSVTSPEKGYHLEVSLKSIENANEFIKLLTYFEITAKAIKRTAGISVYIKDSAVIADFLNAAGAVNALFDYENTKVMKEVRNGVNRLVNCDTANINKTVSAAQKQIKAIKIIDMSKGLSSLPVNLQKAARVRLQYPELKLEELGDMLGIGKSGMNHRLRKIEAIAYEINDEDKTLD